MQINTTISIEADGYCIIEQDVTVHIDVEVDDDLLSWTVSHYTMSGCRLLPSGAAEYREVEVPERLAEVFTQYLDRDRINEAVNEAHPYGDSPSQMRADYYARTL